MRVLVCGSRDWNDRSAIERELDRLHRPENAPLVVIQGGATGADSMAGVWAMRRGVEHECYPANWKKYGKGAGPIRNQQMLDEAKPDLVLAFTNDISESRGTRDMVTRSRKAGVKTLIISGLVRTLIIESQAEPEN